MKNYKLIATGLLIITALFLNGCMADLRTPLLKKEGINTELSEKGKALLARAWRKQGFDKLDQHTVYSFSGTDHWKGMMGKMGKVWPDAKSTLHFKYEIGTFDGQVAFQDGERKGKKAGLQNWKYYEINENQATEFKETNKRIVFGLTAYQYFSEMLSRLKNVPIIAYAGENELRGQAYDLVFCSWNKAEAHQEADQYVVWINKKTGLMDFVQYTVRDNFLKVPGTKMFYGGIEFSDFRDIDGILIPHEQTIYLQKLKEKKKNYLHQLIISDFKFDDFDVDNLKVDKTIGESGDFKS